MSKFTQGQLDAYRDLKVLPYFFERQAFFRMLMAKNRYEQQFGKNVVWDVRLSANTLKSGGKYATFTTGEHGDYTQATLPWAYVWMADAVSGLEAERQGAAGSLRTGTVRKIDTQALDELREDFNYRLATEFIDGDGTDLNGGSGVTFLGLTQSVVTSPSTGTYAGISRVSVSDHRNQQFAATSGPSTSAAQDAWWCLLTAKYSCMRMAGPKKKYKPDLVLAQQGPIIMIKNKGYSQNTNVGASVNGVDMVEGMEIGEGLDDDIASATVFVLSTETFCICSPRAKKDFIRLTYRKNLPNHVHADDEVLVMDAHGQLINEFPKANCVITSFS